MTLAAAIITVTSGAAAIVRTMRASDGASERHQAFVRDVEARMVAMLNQEVGLRGFLASGDEALLEPYHAGEREAIALRDRLGAALTREEHDEIAGAIDAELGAAQRWRTRTAEPQIASRRSSAVVDLPEMIRAGKLSFDDYRAAHGTLRHALDRIAVLQQQRRHDRLTQLGASIIAVVIFFLVVAAGLSRWLVRRAIAPIAALSDAAQRGEVSVDAVRDSRLHEVIVLAETMEQLFRAVQERAMRDGLTRAYNRGFLAEWLPRQLRLARRNKTSFSALMVDLDHFKKINDTLGHAAGDQVLVALARCMEQQLRASDVVVRYGGEEFSVFLPDTPVAGAYVTGERLRAAIAAMTEREGLPAGLRITASIGVAAIGGGDDGSHLLQRADAALYQAKRGGRNRVVAATPAPASAPVVELAAAA